MVFHLQVEANSRKYGELIERYNYFTGVYSTLQKAVEEGKFWLDRRLKELYQKYNYDTNEKDSLTLQDVIDNKEIFYDFTVTKLSPYYADHFEIPRREYECKNLRPTHIIYNYDFKGNVKFKELQYMAKDGSFAYEITRYPGDNENKPNKFDIGDFVTVIDDNIPKEQVFVIYGVPKRNDPKVYFENIYYLSTISDNCKFSCYHEYYEHQLRKYEGKIDSNSPLILLQKYYRNEINIDKGTLEKIELNEIILNTKPTFKEVAELKEGIDNEEKKE